jgi:iron complex outermembrane recepter protein
VGTNAWKTGWVYSRRLRAGRCRAAAIPAFALLIAAAPAPVPALAAAVASASVSVGDADAIDAVVVTATRVAEPGDQVPADLSLVAGSELAARGARDLAGALALVPGVEAPAGGDAGPSSAVPSFWGLHEFDAFLLVVDGVPWGGAFNPAITTLNLTNVERVEVLKGAAPVMYGATSFVGVVQAIHHPAGEASDLAEAAWGNYGSVRGSVATALPRWGEYRHSLALDGQQRGFADARESIADGHALYRGALSLGADSLRIDADLSSVHDVPPSPVLRAGAGLTGLTPIDANFNPADGKLDETRYHLALGYAAVTSHGTWDTLVSFAHSRVTDVRAFLHPDLSGSADTQNQRRYIDDGYLDTHLFSQLSPTASLIVGADLLYGLGRQTTLNGNDAYSVPLDGSVLPPPVSALPVSEIGTLNDRRVFVGQYAQLEWHPDQRWAVSGGVRLNETQERKQASDLTIDPTLPLPRLAAATASRSMVRASETLGLSRRFRSTGADKLTLYADFRHAFKPAAIDFGPDYSPDLLSPETAQSYEAGLKGAAAGGRVNYQAELFLMNFHDLVVPTSSGALANAAAERLTGLEAAASYQLAQDLTVRASAARHDAHYTQYEFFDGNDTVSVAGRKLPLSPRLLASAGVLYAPAAGVNLTAIARYVGPRYLDEENGARVGGYATFDATVGYRLGRYAATLEGTNLGNRRPPVSASEFGSESFYLLPARTLWLRLAREWR